MGRGGQTNMGTRGSGNSGCQFQGDAGLGFSGMCWDLSDKLMLGYSFIQKKFRDALAERLLYECLSAIKRRIIVFDSCVAF